MSAIECIGLTKRLGDVEAVVDLDVPAGSVTGFLGPNGAGKTTVLRLLAGLTRPSAGQALQGGAVARDPVARRPLGYMPSDPGFSAGLSGAANLALLGKLQSADPVDREWACDLLDLTCGVDPGTTVVKGRWARGRSVALRRDQCPVHGRRTRSGDRLGARGRSRDRGSQRPDGGHGCRDGEGPQ